MKIPKLLSTILVAASAVCSSASAQVQMPNTLKPEQKVYGLSKFWQEVNYNFVYLNKVDRKAWDSLYTAMIPVVQQTRNDYEYFHELQRFCAFLKDGHTNIYLPQAIEQKILTSMFGKYRLFIQNIDGHAIITRTNLSIKEEVPVGGEVVEVNGLSTAAYMNKYVRPYISSSTQYVLDDQAASSLLQGPEGSTYNVKIKTPKGAVKNLQLTHARTEEKETIPAFEESGLLTMKWYPGDVAYVALNSFGDRKIDTLFIQKLPELYKAKSLIIDLRNNGGGSTSIGAAILSYLTNDSTYYGSKAVSRLHSSAFKAWGVYVTPKDTINSDWNKKAWLDNHDLRMEVVSSGSVYRNQAKEQRLVVPTAVLIGHNTASAAEDFLILADKQQHMVKIGQNTFGSTGQPYLFDLPGGAKARVCTKKDTYPDGREFVGYGIKPDIEVVTTVKDLINNNDPALNKALRLLKNSTLKSITASKTASLNSK
ncbi:hypothetical protein LLH06_09300 [Mucilaginibacter daejeonensis]|uniref:S41 family peptidase n=1 Tax=Mucilaginibacter daejeonensis TaxID=398049 RepID=UPI001D17CBEA|nr:S41 family peptidase [Mucilaginibacter daejeonensis]UEG55156.1 hypothetical protein LLH06_09300 [Mucilaginibacter daejeonensis]